MFRSPSQTVGVTPPPNKIRLSHVHRYGALITNTKFEPGISNALRVALHTNEAMGERQNGKFFVQLHDPEFDLEHGCIDWTLKNMVKMDLPLESDPTYRSSKLDRSYTLSHATHECCIDCVINQGRIWRGDRGISKYRDLGDEQCGVFGSMNPWTAFGYAWPSGSISTFNWPHRVKPMFRILCGRGCEVTKSYFMIMEHWGTLITLRLYVQGFCEARWFNAPPNIREGGWPSFEIPRFPRLQTPLDFQLTWNKHGPNDLPGFSGFT